MINAFKQIRLTNINLSGNNGRIEAGASGSFIFASELEASGLALTNTINTTGTDLYNLVTGASGVLSASNSAGLDTLSGHLITASGDLNSKIDTVSGNLNTYIDDRISGVIDLAPEALDTLNELAAALNDDENFASNITNFINTGIAAVQSGVDIVSGDLLTLSGALTGNYVTVNTDQTISGNKIFADDVTISGAFSADGSLEVNGGAGTAALFVSGTSVGINTETPSEALDVSGNARITGSLFVQNGIDANNAVISNVAAPVNGADATNLTYVTGVSGSLQSAIDTKVASATQKQFTVLIPTGIESSGISFPGDAFSSTPSVVVAYEGDVAYMSVVKNRTTSGFDIFFSDLIQEEGSYLNVFASNQ